MFSEPSGKSLELGSLALYCGRVVTVVELRQDCGRIVIEHEDDGGRKKRFTIYRSPDFTTLATGQDQLLDTVASLASQELTEHQKRRRLAEVWLADPQVGDCFHREPDFYLTVYEIRPDGSLVCLVTSDGMSSETGAQKSWIFQNADCLRDTFAFQHQPGYALVAHSSTRTYDENSGRKNTPGLRGQSPL